MNTPSPKSDPSGKNIAVQTKEVKPTADNSPKPKHICRRKVTDANILNQ